MVLSASSATHSKILFVHVSTLEIITVAIVIEATLVVSLQKSYYWSNEVDNLNLSVI